jgi:hypothetical protein
MANVAHGKFDCLKGIYSEDSLNSLVITKARRLDGAAKLTRAIRQLKPVIANHPTPHPLPQASPAIPL